MRITRLKRGHRIACTDDEFEALRFLVAQGCMEGEGAGDDFGQTLSSGARRALLSCPKFGAWGALEVDEDRRGR